MRMEKLQMVVDMDSDVNVDAHLHGEWRGRATMAIAGVATGPLSATKSRRCFGDCSAAIMRSLKCQINSNAENMIFRFLPRGAECEVLGAWEFRTCEVWIAVNGKDSPCCILAE